MATEKRRLIDANALLSWLEECTDEKDWIVSQYNADWIWSMIDSAPTVDAVEVVHSSWILNDDGSGTCKHCHRTTKTCWDFDHQMHYCPDYGSKMDGKENQWDSTSIIPRQ
jgi:hypothetical protein